MWSFASNIVARIGLKKEQPKLIQAVSEDSDDEGCSNKKEKGLECPVCWESFNIVENVPYVLLCGHTVCKSCVLALQSVVFKFLSQKIQTPLFISCPLCHSLSHRFVYKGDLKFPRKNYILLWLIESLNADTLLQASSFSTNSQPFRFRKDNDSAFEGQPSSNNLQRASCSHSGFIGSSAHHGSHITRRSPNAARHQFSFQQYFDHFIHLANKIPSVLMFLSIGLVVVPASVALLALYVLITILVALPSFLILYFTCPILIWLIKGITS